MYIYRVNPNPNPNPPTTPPQSAEESAIWQCAVRSVLPPNQWCDASFPANQTSISGKDEEKEKEKDTQKEKGKAAKAAMQQNEAGGGGGGDTVGGGRGAVPRCGCGEAAAEVRDCYLKGALCA